MKVAEFFMWMGPFKYIMIAIAIIIAGLIILKVYDLLIAKNPNQNQMERWLGSIKFWGRFALIMGVLIQLTGMYIALNEIIHASDISPQIVMTGFWGSFNSTLFGLWLLIIALIAWYILNIRYKKLSNEPY